jgi:hypothetical protein
MAISTRDLVGVDLLLKGSSVGGRIFDAVADGLLNLR